jgi:hypothetical protein
MPINSDSSSNTREPLSPTEGLIKLLQQIQLFPAAKGISIRNPLFTPVTALRANPVLAFISALATPTSLNTGEKEWLQQRDQQEVEDMINEVLKHTGD